jgi:hypothetical protein
MSQVVTLPPHYIAYILLRPQVAHFFRDAFSNQRKEASRTNAVRQSHMCLAS